MEPQKSLSLDQKVNILLQMNRGVPPEAISLHLKLNLPDILDITRESLLLEKTEAKLLEDLRQACVALEASKIRSKACALYEKLKTQTVFQGARGEFNASNDWLDDFVRRNGLILTSGEGAQWKRSLRKRRQSLSHFQIEDIEGNLDEVDIYEHLKKRPKSTPPIKPQRLSAVQSKERSLEQINSSAETSVPNSARNTESHNSSKSGDNSAVSQNSVEQGHSSERSKESHNSIERGHNTARSRESHRSTKCGYNSSESVENFGGFSDASVERLEARFNSNTERRYNSTDSADHRCNSTEGRNNSAEPQHVYNRDNDSGKHKRNSRLSRFHYTENAESGDTDWRTKRRGKSLGRKKHGRPKTTTPFLRSDTESESDEIVAILRSDPPKLTKRQRSKSTLNVKIDLQVPDILERLGLRPTETRNPGESQEKLPVEKKAPPEDPKKSKELQRFLQAASGRKSLEAQKSGTEKAPIATQEAQKSPLISKDGFQITPEKSQSEKEDILAKMAEVQARINTLPAGERIDVLEKMQKAMETIQKSPRKPSETQNKTQPKQSTNKRQPLLTNTSESTTSQNVAREVPARNEATAVHLKWGQHHQNMKETIPFLLQEERYVDMTLYCENRKFQCHKLILSASSAYFDEILNGITPLQHPVVIMRGISSEILSALIHYMYEGEVIVEQDKLEELLEVAETLKIKGLHRKIQVNDTSQSTEANKTKETEPDKRNVNNLGLGTRGVIKASANEANKQSAEPKSTKNAPNTNRQSTLGTLLSKGQDVPKRCDAADRRNAITLASLLAESPTCNKITVNPASSNKKAVDKGPLPSLSSASTNGTTSKNGAERSLPFTSITLNKSASVATQDDSNKDKSAPTGPATTRSSIGADRSKILAAAVKNSTTTSKSRSERSSTTSTAPVVGCRRTSQPAADKNVYTAPRSDIKDVEECTAFTKNVEIVSIQSKIQDFDVKPPIEGDLNLMPFSVPCLEDYNDLVNQAANRDELNLAEEGPATEEEIECEIECIEKIESNEEIESDEIESVEEDQASEWDRKCEVIDLDEVEVDDTLLELDDKSFHAMIDRI